MLHKNTTDIHTFGIIYLFCQNQFQGLKTLQTISRNVAKPFQDRSTNATHVLEESQ